MNIKEIFTGSNLREDAVQATLQAHPGPGKQDIIPRGIEGKNERVTGCWIMPKLGHQGRDGRIAPVRASDQGIHARARARYS